MITVAVSGVVNSERNVSDLNGSDFVTLQFLNTDAFGNFATASRDMNKHFFVE